MFKGEEGAGSGERSGEGLRQKGQPEESIDAQHSNLVVSEENTASVLRYEGTVVQDHKGSDHVGPAGQWSLDFILSEMRGY